jgi:hypothetical protein
MTTNFTAPHFEDCAFHRLSFLLPLQQLCRWLCSLALDVIKPSSTQSYVCGTPYLFGLTSIPG